MNEADKPTQSHASAVPDKAAGAARGTMGSTQQSADHALGKLADKVDDVPAEPDSDRLTGAIGAAKDKTMQTVQNASQQLREQAQKASDMAVDYVRAEPIAALLTAAAAGALLMGLFVLIAQSRD